jgi:diaminohydroxyphosphoribosylaminopyrimidine deaminase/5-amino-6-(5-phosphoribosylamino)uracil reductase
MFSDFDHRMMRRALELAALGRYTTHPNPRVGCVIVRAEQIVGEGWHRKWGEPHAEPLALAAAGEAAKGATVYVTLEPHSYQGRTPPCTDALIRAGVARVICATLDANPNVSGQGIAQLQDAGIGVELGLLQAEADALNLGFDKRMRTGMPRVVLKLACSLDGRTALANGASRWITGEQARADVHRLRAAASAVLTGIDTVIFDDPQLTVRDPSIDLAGRMPMRIVVDSKLRMPTTARMLREPGETVVMTSADVNPERVRRIESAGVKVQYVPLDADGRLDMHAVLRELGAKSCNEVLVEAGATLGGSLIELGLVDELVVYIAPTLLGSDGKSMLQLTGFKTLQQTPRFRLCEVAQFDGDLKLIYRPAG